MLRYIYGTDLGNYPRLAATMFRDRATQFQDRLGWDVSVDDQGFERDEYDALNPLYAIWEKADGTHGGSMRFLPTTGRTMARDHFGHLGGAEIASPHVWECTRFCLSPEADGKVAAALMLGGGELMRAFAVDHFLGIFDARMVRIYRMIGASPEVLGSEGTGMGRISIGLWSYSPEARARVIRRAGLSSALSETWFARSFGHSVRPELARTA
ncbi:autoinducer synthase [Loktanella sp. IMCC34160]|uniref:acyl-homoserine-lactone synthase n=1 Tax=Loktanella sp. IMCC34160 TaxID=2510646 RepID=UPI00101D9F23|nr:acyl-homoserine-lactone synthase [Loktanella sp. IMCC34160]RYG92765.1 autoinducer synthase [Loktanella sp. IMCC34160]